MIEYKKLINTPINQIQKALNSAFSDYPIDVTRPFCQFVQRYERYGYVPRASYGAFDSGRLVAFILNSVREIGNRSVAYNCGTGVIPEYRRQGHAKKLFNLCVSSFREEAIKKYVLEVESSNDKAIALYKSLGFEWINSHRNFLIDKCDIPLTDTQKVKLVYVSDLPFDELARYHDFEPTWLNSYQAVMAAKNSYMAAIIEDDDRIVAYGIIHLIDGTISILAVDKAYRRKGYGTRVLDALASIVDVEKITILSVNKNCTSLSRFVDVLGFKPGFCSDEMVLKI